MIKQYAGEEKVNCCKWAKCLWISVNNTTIPSLVISSQLSGSEEEIKWGRSDEAQTYGQVSDRLLAKAEVQLF